MTEREKEIEGEHNMKAQRVRKAVTIYSLLGRREQY